jgi:hypothetical protein
MRLATRDLPLVPLLVPVVAIGLFPLVMLPLLGFLGFVVLGVLIGFAAIMAELEEPQAHVHSVISHGPATRAEHGCAEALALRGEDRRRRARDLGCRRVLADAVTRVTMVRDALRSFGFAELLTMRSEFSGKPPRTPPSS